MHRQQQLAAIFSTLGVLLFFTGIFFFLDTRYQTFLGTDVLYHLQHAQLLAEHGGFTFLSPWFPYHFFAVHPVNPYALHHFVLAQLLNLGGDPILTAKLFAAALSGSVFAALYGVLRHLRISTPFVWTTVCWLVSTGFSFRLLLDRPFTIGILCYFMGTYLLLQKKYLWTGLLMIPYTLAYNLSPLLLLPAIIILIVRGVVEKAWSLKPIIAVLGGLTIALLLHPQTISYILLIKAHLFDIFVLQIQGVPLPVGGEIVPTSPEQTVVLLLIPLLLLLMSCVALGTQLYIPKDTQEKTFVYTLLIHSFLWFPLTLAIHRGIEYWYLLTWLLIAIILAGAWRRVTATVPFWIKRSILGCMILSLCVVAGSIYSLFTEELIHTGKQNDAKIQEVRSLVGKLPTISQRHTLWYPNWWLFPPLFYTVADPLGQQYVAGYDPVFQYLYNPDTYYSWYLLREEGKRCFSKTDCPELLLPSKLLEGVFDSQIAIIPTKPTSSIYRTFASDSRMYHTYQDASYTIFRTR